jgi:biotin transport system substrate-specific component
LVDIKNDLGYPFNIRCKKFLQGIILFLQQELKAIQVKTRFFTVYMYYKKLYQDGKTMKLTTRELILVPLFTALMIAGTFIKISFPLLPVTLQAFFCALAGLILGPRLGALSMTVYTLLGLFGVPVFAQGGGINYIFNNSFGFILGFIAGAYIIGRMSSKRNKPTFTNSLKAVMAGLFVIYSIGIIYMFFIMRIYLGNARIGLYYVLLSNVPYLVKDVILFFAAALSSTSILPVLSKIRTQ